jgi:hypothetical protein
MREVAILHPNEVVGIEAQPHYASQAASYGRVIQRDIFRMDLRNDLGWETSGPLLVIGNPPWVTNAALSGFGSINLPAKTNLKNMKGIDALTGASNFDIAEFILLKLIVELQHEEPTIAMLCKTHVARNVVAYCAELGLPMEGASMRRINAKRWFGANVDACLFTVTVRSGSYDCAVYAHLQDVEPLVTLGVRDGRLVADVDAYGRSRFADGKSPVEWRQGVKHDAAGVIELLDGPHGIMNRSGEPVDVEESFLFPLLKSTDLFRDRLQPSKWMIVPQRHLREDTRHLEISAPRLWSYLIKHRDVFEGRQSSIYRGRPPFAIFGVGDYTFAPYKVAVSGLHKEARFRLIGPAEGRPVMLDDTSYFLAFETAVDAALVQALISGPECHDLIAALVFWDAKRPITKKLLQRIDLVQLGTRAQTSAVLGEAGRMLQKMGSPHSGLDSAWKHLLQRWNGLMVDSGDGDQLRLVHT